MNRLIIKFIILLAAVMFLAPGMTLAGERAGSAPKKQFGSLERGKKSLDGQTNHYDRHRHRSRYHDRDHFDRGHRYRDRHRGRRGHDHRRNYGRNNHHRNHNHHYDHHYYHNHRHYDRHHYGHFIFDPEFFFSFGFHDRW